LPSIIAGEYINLVQYEILLLLSKLLAVLGNKMRSLVYVLQIKGNFNAYIQVTKTSVKEELPDELFKLDLHTNSQKHFCVRQKDHPLHRLFKDNRRFECAINFETEKGEMFNKFIGGQLFLKNHLNPSKDVALRNYKQQILK
ncbi:hypothetical protein V8B55DRAFT_1327123, partial [Mucor lusitanicus]